MLRAAEINMAVCQAASQRKQDPQQRGARPVSREHYQKSKAIEGLKGRMEMTLHKDHFCN